MHFSKYTYCFVFKLLEIFLKHIFTTFSMTDPFTIVPFEYYKDLINPVN